MEQILKDLGNDNLYKILKIEKYAGPEKIKKAYKKLIKVYHPDKNKDSNTVHIFESVRKAYEILQNSENKIAYDEYLKRKDEKASRIKTFSEKRKKFIDDLKKRENESKMQFKDDQHTKTPATDFFVKEKKKDSNEDDYMGSIGINKKISSCGVKIKWSKNSDLIFTKDVIKSFFKSYGTIEDIRIEETKCQASLLFECETIVDHLLKQFPNEENLNKIFKIKKCDMKKFEDVPIFLDSNTLNAIKNMNVMKNSEFMNKIENKADDFVISSKEKSNIKMPSYDISLEELEKIAFETLRKLIKK